MLRLNLEKNAIFYCIFDYYCNVLDVIEELYVEWFANKDNQCPHDD